MSDLGPLTWWVAILTVLVGVQLVAVALLAFRAMQFVKRAETAFENAERTLQPVVSETKNLIDDIRSLRQTTQRVEHGISTALDRASTGMRHLKIGVTYRFWPVLGVVAAGRAILTNLSARRRASRRMSEDDLASARFVAEGGPIHDSR